MIKSIFISVLLLMSLFIQAQSLELQTISSAGADLTAPTGEKLNLCIGEIATESLMRDGLRITQGFHQYFEMSTSIKESSEEDFNIRLFPNPTIDWITLDADFYNQDFDIQIVAIDGTQVYQNKFSGSEKRIELSHLTAGSYVLLIYDSHRRFIDQIQFQKIN